MKAKTLARWCATLAAALPLAAAAEGVGIYGGFVGIGVGNAAPYQWHNAGLTGHNFIEDSNFDQVDLHDRFLGTFAQGSSAFLSAGQIITFKGPDEQVASASMHYCVRQFSSTCATYTTSALTRDGEVGAGTGFDDAAGYRWEASPNSAGLLGDRLWNGLPAVDFLNGLVGGDYALEVYFSALGDLVPASEAFSLNGVTSERSFVALFSVAGATGTDLPEPPSLALAGLTLGLLAASARRRR